MKSRFAIVLLAIAMLCVTALAQEKTADYWIKIGDDLALNKSNTQEALAAYEKAIQIDPDNIGAWDNKALVLYILDQQAYRKVLDLSEMRLTKNPQDARAWQAHAEALASLGRQDEANQSSKKALEIYDQEINDNPKNATAWSNKAGLTANQTEALAAYDKVIDLNGSMKISALITKGNILLNLGKSDEAIAAIDKAVHLDPENFDAWNEKAFYYNALGKYNESLATFEKLTELKPENALAWKGKGDSLKALGRNSEADAAYAKAKDLGYQG
jgi:tetratricopeptide (TPR) repeat protein